jgi:hypothetical protein
MAEEETHSGVLWATTRTQRGAAWAAHTSSDFGCSALAPVIHEGLNVGRC